MNTHIRAIVRIPALFALAASLMLASCRSTQAESEESTSDSVAHISMAEGLSLLGENPDGVLVDVRTKSEYKQGHIPAAILFPLGSISEKNAAQILPNKGQMIFVYCRSGHRTRIASDKLAKLGYGAIYEIGGIIDYTGEIEKQP